MAREVCREDLRNTERQYKLQLNDYIFLKIAMLTCYKRIIFDVVIITMPFSDFVSIAEIFSKPMTPIT